VELPDGLGPEFLKKLEYLRLVARRVHTGRFSALQRSRKLGRGIDFADHRAYTPGDDFKDIDWTLYGRMDRLMVRLAEEETELNLHLLVDVSRSMAGPFGERPEPGDGDGRGGISKSEYVRRSASALAYVALAHLDRVHVWPFGAGLQAPLSPPRHKAQAVQVYRFLVDSEQDGPTDLLGSVKSFCSVARGRGIALLLSDFLSPSGWQGALDLLRHARFEAGIVQVSGPDEHEVPARGELLLRDAESGRVRRVRVTERIAQAYRAAFLAHGQALQDYARAHDLFFAHARSDQPFEELVLQTMRAGRLLQ
jgi:uncharacterized protein (DUF58 family)